MIVVLGTEARVAKTPDGLLWVDDSLTQAMGRWAIRVDALVLFARVDLVTEVPQGMICAPPLITTAPAPSYSGLYGYLSSRRALRDAAQQAIVTADAAVVRAPGPVSAALSIAARRAGVPYAAEVVGDPWDVFAPGAARTPLRPLVRLTGRLQLARVVRRAVSALYVTQSALQRRYPTSRGCPMFGASDVVLPERADNDSTRTAPSNHPARIVTVASMWQEYKRVDLSLDVVAELHQRIRVELVVIGDGPLRDAYEKDAQRRHLPVRFLGQLPHEQVLDQLSASDLFMSTSYVEGLPRAHIEAMHVGLPCIAFDVGGTRELAPGVVTVPRGEVTALARQALAILEDGAEFAARSAASLTTASRFTTDQRQSTFDKFVSSLFSAVDR
jgi:glycosyltransferase involved in cell wall biosynthesis